MPGECGTANHSRPRQQYERPQQTTDQCAEVVGGIEVGQYLSGALCVVVAATGLQERHQQRHFGTDEDADQRGRRHQNCCAGTEEREGHVQRDGTESADQPEQNFDGHKRDGRMPQQRFGGQRSDTQSRNKSRDDQRRLGDAAAGQTHAECQQGQLVDQATRSARRNSRKEKDACARAEHRRTLVNCHIGISGNHQVSAAAFTKPMDSKLTPTAHAAPHIFGSCTSATNLPGRNAFINRSAIACNTIANSPYTAESASP